MWGWYLLNDDEKASILRGIRKNRVYGGPYNAEIHPTDRCNAKCFFCSTPKLTEGKDQLPTGVIMSTLSQLAKMGLKSVRLAGGGEPLFHHARDMILDFLDANRIRICNITTNAILLSCDVSDHLVKNKCDEILISLNASNPQSYEKIMGLPGSVFTTVCNRVDYLHKKKLEAKQVSPQMVIQFVLTKNNINEIPEMYKLGRDLGADTIFFRDLWDIGDQQIVPGQIVAIKDILKIDPEAKVIVSSGYSNDPLMADFKAYGFTGALPKPNTNKELIATLKNITKEVSSQKVR